ncbi:CASP-like protein 2B1 [Phalaenopsis equestris]|uniref:CASP-like protein 2B1 n=1 Tax=Phalaenopsis equestris TaxID=78828 RepID=UPI0009E630AF|nr:CASP-like protein 2B1 [Phalaenopsis equestris]
MERRLRVSELALRLAALGFAVTASALVGGDSQVRTFFSMEKKAKFTDMKTLLFLVAANGIAAGYNLLQVVRCFVGMMKGSVLFGKGLALVVFSCDQVMAYMALAAMAAAVQSGVIVMFGQPEFQWMKICNLYRRFCMQAGEGLACAFVACLAMIIISCISAFNFFRLYGISRGFKNSNGSW